MSLTPVVAILSLALVVGIGGVLPRTRSPSMSAIAASMTLLLSSVARGPQPALSYVRFGGLVVAGTIVVAGFATTPLAVLRRMRIELVLLFALILAIGASDSVVPDTSSIQRPLMFAEYGLVGVVTAMVSARLIAAFIRRSKDQRAQLKAS